MILKISGLSKDTHQTWVSRAIGRIEQSFIEKKLPIDIFFLEDFLRNEQNKKQDKKLLVEMFDVNPDQTPEIIEKLKKIIGEEIPGYQPIFWPHLPRR